MRILATAGAGYLGRVGAALVVLVTIPLARRALEPDLFGVWMMLGSLLAFFAFADLGVGNGVLSRLGSPYVARDESQRRRVIHAGYVCTSLAGAALLAAWGCWIAWSPSPTAVVGTLRAEHRGEVLTALHLFVALTALNIPASMVQKIQLASQRGHWVGLTQLAAALATLMAVAAVLSVGGGLVALVMASLGVQVAANLGSALLWRARSAPRTPARPVRLEWPVVAALLQTGGFFFTLQLAVAFAFQSDAIVITQRLGQSAYGDFAIVQRLFLAVSSVLLAGLAGLWPAISDALVSGDTAWIRRTLVRSYGFVALTIGAASVALALLAPRIVVAWAGLEIAPAAALLVVLAAWTTVDALGNVSGAFLNAAGLLRAQLLFAVLMASAAFGLKWLLVDAVGAWGAVAATLVAYVCISIPAQAVLITRRLRDARAQG